MTALEESYRQLASGTSDFNRCDNRGSDCRSWREAAH